MNTITLKLTDKQIKKLVDTYSESLSEKIPQYADFLILEENCRITVYQSKKVVFQGKDALVYASAFDNSLVDKQEKENISESIEYEDSAGSDEVGTGDYFGPVVVCAAIVTKEDAKKLDKYNIKDSKKLTDEYILKTAPEIMKFIKHSCLVLGNQKYNQIHQQYNLNAIKAILHNKVYLNLDEKYDLPDKCIIDQFAPESLYFRYLKGQADIYRKLHFETKAESKYLAVAVASMIARYTFLKKWDEINEFYEMTFSKGAGKKVNEDAAEFVRKYGKNRLNEVAKIHFKNTELLEEYL